MGLEVCSNGLMLIQGKLYLRPRMTSVIDTLRRSESQALKNAKLPRPFQNAGVYQLPWLAVIFTSTAFFCGEPGVLRPLATYSSSSCFSSRTFSGCLSAKLVCSATSLARS